MEVNSLHRPFTSDRLSGELVAIDHDDLVEEITEYPCRERTAMLPPMTIAVDEPSCATVSI
jgi:hypothetical protein